MPKPLALLLCLLALPASCLGDDRTVLPETIDGKPSRQMLRTSLRRRADEAFARRKAGYEELETAEDVAAYQTRLRAFLLKQLGEFPERTPLNANRVGVIDHGDCTIEKIMFESRPGFVVTGNFYRPKSEPPFPAVIVPCGHTSNGKASSGYQKIAMLLARNGIAAFVYDPIGQGERYQILDGDGRRRFKPTDEHTLVGVGSILVGRNTAHYRIWDGIRALDYVASRKDVDPERLGCTGSSGGGTLTQYLMAIDDRVACAVPSCCVTTFDRRFANNTIGDAEQNVFGQIAFGLDHADYTLMRAPKPTLYGTATHDFMDIEGSWEIFRESKRIYSRLGYAERIDLIEVDGKHGFSRPKREAAVRWLSRWLLERDEPITEPELTTLPEADLLCTPRGQVGVLAGARTVMDENATVANAYAIRRRIVWSSPEKAVAEVRRLVGTRSLDALAKIEPRFVGTFDGEETRVRKLVFDMGDGVLVPGLLWTPKTGNAAGRTLVLHGDGKSADGVRRLAREGHAVLAIDVRGLGETGPPSRGIWGGGWSEIWMSYLLGDTLVGRRAEDVLAAARWFGEFETEKRRPVGVVAEGVTIVPALHAVAFEPRLFGTLEMFGGTEPWANVVQADVPRGELVNAVHGALEHYDLPDLVRIVRQSGVEVLETESGE